MKNTPALKEQNFRLEEAYQRMNDNGRDSLDSLVGQLAELDQMIRKVPKPECTEKLNKHCNIANS